MELELELLKDDEELNELLEEDTDTEELELEEELELDDGSSCVYPNVSYLTKKCHVADVTVSTRDVVPPTGSDVTSHDHIPSFINSFHLFIPSTSNRTGSWLLESTV